MREIPAEDLARAQAKVDDLKKQVSELFPMLPYDAEAAIDFMVPEEADDDL
jgi:hypothetical protein